MNIFRRFFGSGSGAPNVLRITPASETPVRPIASPGREQRPPSPAEAAVKGIFPNARIVSTKDIGAAYGVQAIDDTALSLIQSGIRAQESGNFTLALSLYKKALVLEPTSVDAHNGLAATHIGLGDLDEAIKEHRLAIQAAPPYVAEQVQVIYVNLANAILKKKLGHVSIEEFRSATLDLPHRSGYHCGIGLIHWKVGNSGDARSAFEEVLKIAPSGVCGQAAREWLGMISRGEVY